MVSLHETTCSKIRGRMCSLYSATSTPCSWLRRTRFVPTRMRSSCRSFSRFFLSFCSGWLVVDGCRERMSQSLDPAPHKSSTGVMYLVLHAAPEAVGLAEVLEDELVGVLHRAAPPLVGRAHVGELVAAHLRSSEQKHVCVCVNIDIFIHTNGPDHTYIHTTPHHPAAYVLIINTHIRTQNTWER